MCAFLAALSKLNICKIRLLERIAYRHSIHVYQLFPSESFFHHLRHSPTRIYSRAALLFELNRTTYFFIHVVFGLSVALNLCTRCSIVSLPKQFTQHKKVSLILYNVLCHKKNDESPEVIKTVNIKVSKQLHNSRACACTMLW